MFGSLIGAGVALFGANKASKDAKKATQSAERSEAAQLAFAQEQYDDWKSVFGPIQDNLSGFYGNLSSEYFETLGLETVTSEFDRLSEDLNRSLAQRGITDSGVALSLDRDLGIQEAEMRAEVRRSAPTMAREEQSRFLQIGMGLNPTASMSQTLAQTAQGARQRATMAQQSSAQATANAIKVIGSAGDDLASKLFTGGTA